VAVPHNAAEPHPKRNGNGVFFSQNVCVAKRSRRRKNAVDSFIQKHQDKITGTLFCPDRLIFKGHLPTSNALGLENFLGDQGIRLKDFKNFGPQQAQGPLELDMVQYFRVTPPLYPSHDR
jgi:hypothetical protein